MCLFIAKNVTGKLFLKKDLYTFKMLEGGYLDRITQFNKKVIDLLQLEVTVEDEITNYVSVAYHQFSII